MRKRLSKKQQRNFMSNAKKDDNGVSTLIGVLNTDGATIIPVQANPTTHRLEVSDGTSGSDNGPTNALKDGNFVSSLIAVSSSDGVTPVVVYTDANGHLLVQTT